MRRASVQRGRRLVGLLALAFSVACSDQPSPGSSIQSAKSAEPHVVVATLDTGSNLFHPTWRREQYAHPSEFIPGYPADAGALPLAFMADLPSSIAASGPALDRLAAGDWPLWLPGTNLIALWAHASDDIPIFDQLALAEGRPPDHAHGAQASSQIAGSAPGHSLAPGVFLVIMDSDNNASVASPDQGPDTSIHQATADGLRWAAAQSWIDIVHVNLQNLLPLAGATPAQVPRLEGQPEAMRELIASGKLVVVAAGNYYAEATETSPYAGVPGALVVGANDNCADGGGYSEFSNPDPHVVMDGSATVSAAPDSFADAPFGGTSSASPRAAGYAAELLLRLRREFGYSRGMVNGALLELTPEQALPSAGPLADGRLEAAELHEVIRKTANPNPHVSEFDGGTGTACITQPADLPAAVYPKMGYGEISEQTLPRALAVLLGAEPLPERALEDQYFGFSEQVRDSLWGQ